VCSGGEVGGGGQRAQNVEYVPDHVYKQMNVPPQCMQMKVCMAPQRQEEARGVTRVMRGR